MAMNKSETICTEHNEVMLANSFDIYPVCQSCAREQKEREQTKKDYANTRFPEGAEI